MSAVARGRFTAELDPDEHAGLVLFHIGMRINRIREPRTWVPVLHIPRMLRELTAHAELGLLSFEVYRSGRTVLVVQYWRDFDALNPWARSADAPHRPGRAVLARLRRAELLGSVRRRPAPAGVARVQPGGPSQRRRWGLPRDFVIGAGGSETVYVDMPVMGLARATRHGPIERRGQSAAHRLDPATADVASVAADEML